MTARRRPFRIILDAEMAMDDYDYLFDLIAYAASAFTDNFDVSGSLSPADACYPHPLGHEPTSPTGT